MICICYIFLDVFFKSQNKLSVTFSFLVTASMGFDVGHIHWLFDAGRQNTQKRFSAFDIVFHVRIYPLLN